jgi:hypothetical protein
MKKVPLSIFTLLFLLFSVNTVFASTYTISGAVSGATTDDVTITITNAAGTVVDTQTTAGGGVYTSAALTSGLTYKVTPTKTNYIFSGFFANITLISNATAINFFSAPSSTAGLTPTIEILPSATVEVGQEVYISAMGSTIPSDVTLGCTAGNLCGRKTEYRWNFGDGYACQKESGAIGGFDAMQYINCKGLALTHFFMTPGTYTITLNAIIWDSWAAGTATGTGTPLASGTATATITVTGTAPLAGFEIQHAPFNNRTKQYLYIQIPAGNRTASYDLVLSLLDVTASTSSTLLTKNNPGAEEIYLFDHTTLTASHDYVIQAQILNNGDSSQVTGGLYRELFTTPASTPTVTIDENNSFSVSGNKFFPVGPFMCQPDSYSGQLISSAHINAMSTEGYYLTHTPTTYATWLASLVTNNLVAIGPGRGNFAGEDSDESIAKYWAYNHDTNNIVTYINNNKNSPAVFAWSWHDEPNLGSMGSKALAPIMGAWNYIGHINDANHPSFNLMYGYDWSTALSSSASIYDYLGNSWLFGGKKWVQDAIPFDVYAYAYRLHPALNMGSTGPIASYLTILDRASTFNKSLVPIIPTLEPSAEPARGTIPGVIPTDDQNYSLCWLNVIHGAKGITWFIADAATTRWTSMGKFTQMMNGGVGYTALKDIILGTPPSKTVTRTDKANAALDRVDTMIRESGGVTYVVAARVTEPDPITGMITYPTYPSVTAGTGLSGYQLNDVLAISGGAQGTVTVNIIGAGGSITGIYLSNSGYGYSVSTGNATTCTRSGGVCTGASGTQIDIPTVVDSLYAGTEPTTVTPTFTVSELTGTTITPVYGESRNVTVVDGVFTDNFAKDAVHIYQIGAGTVIGNQSIGSTTTSGSARSMGSTTASGAGFTLQ